MISANNKTAPVVAAFEPDDATAREYELADGQTLCVECSDAGLIGGHDFRLANGAVIRFERRIVQVIPSYWEARA